MRKIVVIFFMISAFVAYGKEKGNIKVVVEKFSKPKGNVKIALYNSKDGFPDNSLKAITTASIVVTDTTAVYTFEQMEYGEYAAGVYYDENSNGKLDSGLFGIPLEGVGASNNPKAKMGPPSYDDAKFLLSEKEREVRIKVSGVK